MSIKCTAQCRSPIACEGFGYCRNLNGAPSNEEMVCALRTAEEAIGNNLQWITDLADLHIRQKNPDTLSRLIDLNRSWQELVKMLQRAG